MEWLSATAAAAAAATASEPDAALGPQGCHARPAAHTAPPSGAPSEAWAAGAGGDAQRGVAVRGDVMQEATPQPQPPTAAEVAATEAAAANDARAEVAKVKAVAAAAAHSARPGPKPQVKARSVENPPKGRSQPQRAARNAGKKRTTGNQLRKSIDDGEANVDRASA